MVGLTLRSSIVLVELMPLVVKDGVQRLLECGARLVPSLPQHPHFRPRPLIRPWHHGGLCRYVPIIELLGLKPRDTVS